MNYSSLMFMYTRMAHCQREPLLILFVHGFMDFLSYYSEGGGEEELN